jgi:general stress protein 26
VAALLTGVASMATVTPDGDPHVAVVTPVVIDDVIWIGTYRSSQKAANLLARPSIALVWSTDAEAYVWGRAELLDDVQRKRSMWDDTWPYDPAMFFSTPDNPDYVLVRVTPRRAMVMRFGEHGPERSRWSA